jgi:transposase-like protein
MAANEFSIPALARRIQTEADAYRMLEELRWKDGQPEACPHCGEVGRCYFLTPKNGTSRKTRTGAESQRRVWKCGGCRKQFSVLTGTIFHGSRVSIRTWFFVVVEMCSAKNGVSAREIERKYAVTPKTAWFMLHRIREAMRLEPLAGLLAGTVIADETWIGGRPSNRHGGGRYGQGVRGVTDKTPVLALVHKDSRTVRSRVVPNVTAKTLRPSMLDLLDFRGTVLHTDSAQAYKSLAPEFAGHEYVNHFSHEYVRGEVSTNMAEGYFSQLKRSLDGTYHHVSDEHLHRYLGQFDFMYNTCKLKDSDRVRALVNRTDGCRLSYRPLKRSRQTS